MTVQTQNGNFNLGENLQPVLLDQPLATVTICEHYEKTFLEELILMPVLSGCLLSFGHLVGLRWTGVNEG